MAARWLQNGEWENEKKEENSGHYVIASSRTPERGPLERRMLAPIKEMNLTTIHFLQYLCIAGQWARLDTMLGMGPTKLFFKMLLNLFWM